MTMTNDDYHSNRRAFLKEFEEYIGHEYLDKKHVLIGESTRFDQLNFDIVDEVVTEYLVDRHFGLENFTCDDWPETIGGLLDVISDRLQGRGGEADDGKDRQ